jgi:hypothetical protein
VVDFVVSQDNVVHATFTVAVECNDLTLVHMWATTPEVTVLDGDMVAADHDLAIRLDAAHEEVSTAHADSWMRIVV